MGYHAPGTQIMAKTAVNIGDACAGTLSGKWIIVLLEALSGTLPLRVRLTIVFWHSAC